MHGWSLTWQTWLPVLDLLAAERDVIAIDLPGFSGSPSLPEGDRYTLDRLCEEVEAFFGRLGLDGPDIAGNSLGALISLRLACRGSVRTVTGLCTPGFYGPVSVLRPLMLAPAGALARTPLLGPVLRAPRGAAMARKFVVARPELIEDETWLATLMASAAAPGAMRFVAHNLWPIPVFRDRPAVPVTLAWGSHDRIIPSVTAVRAKRILPDARQVLLPAVDTSPCPTIRNSSHGPCSTDHAEQAGPSPPGRHRPQRSSDGAAGARQVDPRPPRARRALAARSAPSRAGHPHVRRTRLQRLPR